MSLEAGVETGSDWRKFLRNHWSILTLFAVAAVIAFVGAVYVFLWFVGNAQSTSLVPSTLGLWTMGHVVAFILYLIFWELVFIGIPVAIGGAVGWLWWRRLPAEERSGYRFPGRRSRTAGGSGGASFFLWIVFAVKVYLDGNWNVAIATFTLNYVVGIMITILIWIGVIIGIPGAIALVWWVRREMRKSP